MAKLGRHRELLHINSGLGISNKLTEGHRMHSNALFDQPVEEHAPMCGLAPVEPEREFVEIGLQVFFFERALMRAHQPALNQRGDAVYARQDLVGVFAGAFDGRSMMEVFVFGCAGIRCQPVGVYGRTRFDMLLNKRLERFGFRVGDDLQAATPEAFGRQQLHGNSHQHLAFGAASALAVPHATKNRLVHLDVTGQHVVPGMADRAPEPVQHRPSRLIGTESEDPMQRFGGYAIFSRGQVPGSSKPNGQRRSGAVKDRARRGGYAVAARIAPPFTVLHAPALGPVARWAGKSALTANPVKVVEAGRIIRKPRQKLGVVARVINPCFGRLTLRGCIL